MYMPKETVFLIIIHNAPWVPNLFTSSQLPTESAAYMLSQSPTIAPREAEHHASLSSSHPKEKGVKLYALP
jgi:hypothetical protein